MQTRQLIVRPLGLDLGFSIRWHHDRLAVYNRASLCVYICVKERDPEPDIGCHLVEVKLRHQADF